MKLILFIVVILATGVFSLPSFQVRNNERRIVCYVGTWASYRPGMGNFQIENIDPFICTHVIYAFAALDPETNQIISYDPLFDIENNGFKRFTNLSQTNPKLKCILGIGGWNECETPKYSVMANDPAKRTAFVNSVVPFLKQYGFHGLDMDWEYPTQRGGQQSDKQAFVELLKELKAVLEPEGMLLSAAVAAGKDTIDAAYDVPQIVQHLDFLNIMTYDFHGTWEWYTGLNSPLHPSPEESSYQQMLNCEFAIKYWLKLGASTQILNLGIPTYGHNYLLGNPSNHGVYAPTAGPGEAGPYTQTAGTLGYNEICEDLKESGWEIVIDPYYMAPYAYNDKKWVGYDDETSVAEKCKFANLMELEGVMIWSMETDDFQPTCGPTPFPLLTVINEYIRGIYSNVTAAPPSTTAPSTGPTAPPTPPPPPPPPPTDVCKYPGFQADPNDCSTFYNCIPNSSGGWDIFTFHCSAGTVFDPSIDSCNYSDNVPDCHATN